MRDRGEERLRLVSMCTNHVYQPRVSTMCINHVYQPCIVQFHVFKAPACNPTGQWYSSNKEIADYEKKLEKIWKREPRDDNEVDAQEEQRRRLNDVMVELDMSPSDAQLHKVVYNAPPEKFKETWKFFRQFAPSEDAILRRAAYLWRYAVEGPDAENMTTPAEEFKWNLINRVDQIKSSARPPPAVLWAFDASRDAHRGTRQHTPPQHPMNPYLVH